jgi:hypothetical protein
MNFAAGLSVTKSGNDFCSYFVNSPIHATVVADQQSNAAAEQ